MHALFKKGIYFLIICAINLDQSDFSILDRTPFISQVKSGIQWLLFADTPHFSVWDQLPVVSQLKSFILNMWGDTEGAHNTCNNFLGTPFIPPIPMMKAFHEKMSGLDKAASQTLATLEDSYRFIFDGIPILGHIKALERFIYLDFDGGARAMKSATRTTFVMGCGAGGNIIFGLYGAVGGGMICGTLVDLAATGFESIMHLGYSPCGQIAAITKIFSGDATTADYFDTVAGFLGVGCLSHCL